MSAFELTAQAVLTASEWTRLGLETFGAATIAVGGVLAVRELIRSGLGSHDVNFTAARFVLARYLVLALEFQLAADVLETAIAPEWTKIGQLAAIATIRTALNYFLTRELKEEQAELKETSARPAQQRAA